MLTAEDQLAALADVVALAEFDRADAELRDVVDKAMRAVLVATSLGISCEWWVLPEPWPAAAGAGGGVPAGRDLLGTAMALGTLAGAADLDPMDIGPSHTPLTATLASCLAAAAVGAPAERVADGVLAGMDIALRLRRVVTGTRPGVGFHSPGVFGTIAAAAAAARTMGLSRAACADAIAIALTRAGGLAINSAATRIGLTHFGWGTAHGLEAALLAGQGWTASHDLEKAFGTLFPAAPPPDLGPIGEHPVITARDVMFKHFPCNIYLNLVVLALERLGVGQGPEPIRIDLPLIPHLDGATPGGVRAARNSAQAVVGIAVGAGTGYPAFCGTADDWRPDGAVTDAMRRVELRMDPDVSTRLDSARVRVSSGGRSSEHTMGELTAWGADHALRLTAGVVDPELVRVLYGPDVREAFDAVFGLFRRQSVRSA